MHTFRPVEENYFDQRKAVQSNAHKYKTCLDGLRPVADDDDNIKVEQKQIKLKIPRSLKPRIIMTGIDCNISKD
jgi:hypothetical protein